MVSVGIDDRGQMMLLGVDAVDIGVMQQALALQHVDIGHARQGGELLHAFLDAVGLKGLGRRPGVTLRPELADERGGAQAGDADGVLVLMLLDAVDRRRRP
jgi:hypothetical protein